MARLGSGPGSEESSSDGEPPKNPKKGARVETTCT